MNVTVKGRGVDVTPAMREYAQKKLSKVAEFDPDIRVVEVTCKTEHNFHKVEVMLSGDGVRLRGEERRPDYYEAVDVVLEKLEQQARKHHKRQIERNRSHSAREVPAAFAAAVAPNPDDYSEPSGSDVPGGSRGMSDQGTEEGNGVPRITRTKRFPMKPMAAVDAATEMDMMGHSFFVFRNIAGDVNVVYRRNDGSFGLIEVGE